MKSNDPIETQLHSLLQEHNNGPKATVSSIKTPTPTGQQQNTSPIDSDNSGSDALAALINEKQQDFSYVFQPFITDHRRLLELFNTYFKDKSKDTFNKIKRLFIVHSNLEELGLYQAASNYLLPNSAQEEDDDGEQVDNMAASADEKDGKGFAAELMISQLSHASGMTPLPTPSPFNDAVPLASQQPAPEKPPTLKKTPSSNSVTGSTVSFSSTATARASVSSDMQLQVQQLLRELPEEHGKLLNVFEELCKMPSNDPKFQVFMKRLYQDLKNHMDAEELILFPIMFARIPMDALLQMRQTWEDEHKYERRNSTTTAASTAGDHQGSCAAADSAATLSCK